MVETVLDSYSETNYASANRTIATLFNADYSAYYQTFKTPNDGKSYLLSSCKFYLSKSGSPTGVINAVVYDHTGTFGVDGKPTGAALATSDNFSVSTLTTGKALATLTFSGVNKITLTPNTAYALALQGTSGTVNVLVGYDDDSSTAQGTYGGYVTAAWSGGWAANDLIFYVYGNPPDTYTISADANGSCAPTGAQSILVNTDVTPTADPTFIFSYWLLDGVYAGVTDPYTAVYVGGETHTLEAIFTSEIVLDSYSETNFDLYDGFINVFSGDQSAYGQSFKTPADKGSCRLSKCKFYLCKAVGMTGTVQAELYAMTGSYGSTGRPTGSALAVSDVFDISTLTGFPDWDLSTLTFSGANQITLAPDTAYCLALKLITVSGSYLYVGYDNSAATHSGNKFYYLDSAWVEMGGNTDFVFYVYGIPGPVATWTISTHDSNGVVYPTGAVDISVNTVCTATPNTYFSLDHWLLDTVDIGDANPYTMVFAAHTTHTLEAFFTQTSFPLTVTKINAGTLTPTEGLYVYPYDGTLTDNFITTSTANISKFISFLLGDFATSVQTFIDPTVISYQEQTDHLLLFAPGGSQWFTTYDHLTIQAYFANYPGLKTAGSFAFPTTLAAPSLGTIPDYYANANDYGISGTTIGKKSSVYAAGLWWHFYQWHDTPVTGETQYDFVPAFSTSVDGVTWSAKTVITSLEIDDVYTEQPIVVCNGNLIYMVAKHQTFQKPALYYNVAKANSNGTLTFLNASWQEIIHYHTYPLPFGFYHIDLCLDKQSRPWITYSLNNGDDTSTYFIDHSTNSGKTWVGAGGIFPYTLADLTNAVPQYSTACYVGVKLVCYSDNTVLAASAGLMGWQQDYGKAWRFNESKFLNSYDLCMYPCIYPFETQLIITKDDRVFMASAFRPLATYINDGKRPLYLIELGKSNVVNAVAVNTSNMYGASMAYDPEYNLIYILGTTDFGEVTPAVDLKLWVFKVDQNILSSRYTLIAGALNNSHYSESLEYVNLSHISDPNHNFLLTYMGPDNAHVSATINYYSLFNETAQPYESKLYTDVCNSIRRGVNTDLAVTRQDLVLDLQDTATGFFNVHYNSTPINMIIQPKSTSTAYNLEAGRYTQYSLTGVTANTIREGDRVTDKYGNCNYVVAVEPFTVGNVFGYYTCQLEKIEPYVVLGNSYTASAVDDSISRTKVWLDTYLTAANLPSYITTYSFPINYPLIRVFYDKAIDVVFSFSKPVSTAIYQGDKTIYGYEENVPIVISAIDKGSVSGKTLLWQAETEIRRLCQTQAFGSLRLMNNNRDKTTRQGVFTLHSAEFTLTYRRTTT
jgi:hypothetical protein